MTDEGSVTTDCVCGHRRSHHGRRCCAQHDHCQWDGCVCPHYAQAAGRSDVEKAVADARRQAFTEAWQAVGRAVRPLGTECGQSRWNAGYTQARDEAQNAILELRDRRA